MLQKERFEDVKGVLSEYEKGALGMKNKLIFVEK